MALQPAAVELYDLDRTVAARKRPSGCQVRFHSLTPSPPLVSFKTGLLENGRDSQHKASSDFNNLSPSLSRTWTAVGSLGKVIFRGYPGQGPTKEEPTEGCSASYLHS